MKASKKLFILLAILLISGFTRAVNHTILVSDFEFNPSNLQVQLGDSVTWVWNNGSHTTTSDMIPANAAGWNVPVNSGAQSFTYKVSESGTYNYHCIPHQFMGMNGSFTAGGTKGINTSTTLRTGFSLYRNASASSISLKFHESTSEASLFRLMDLSGRTVFSHAEIQVEKGKSITLYPGMLRQGIYLAELSSGNRRDVKRIVVD